MVYARARARVCVCVCVCECVCMCEVSVMCINVSPKKWIIHEIITKFSMWHTFTWRHEWRV